MQAVIETKTKTPKQPNSESDLFVDRYRGADYWYAWWYDQVGRIVRRRIGLFSTMSEDEAKEAARKAYDDQVKNFEKQIADRAKLSQEEIEAYAQIASFPRIVVAHFIRHVCNRIARSEAIVEQQEGQQPGLQLFAERTGISSREAHRLIEDEERISVGSDTVDKICVQFDLLIDDFITESMEWAERRGRWADRPGVCDSWPVGYFSSNVKEERDLHWMLEHQGSD